MADHFARPLRLTRNEALALYLRGTELSATPGMPDAPALRSALDKLRGIPRTRDARGCRRRSRRRDGGQAPEHLERSARPRATHERVCRSTTSRTRPASGRREIDPEAGLRRALGHWYVAAWDVRCRRRAALPRRSDPAVRGDGRERSSLAASRAPGGPLHPRRDEDVPVRLRLPPGGPVDRRVLRDHGRARGADGSLDITMPARSLGWVARLLLRVGRDATVLEPPDCRTRSPTLARRHARPIRAVTSPLGVAPFGPRNTQAGRPLRR